jgi:hypothetical protein
MEAARAYRWAEGSHHGDLGGLRGAEKHHGSRIT